MRTLSRLAPLLDSYDYFLIDLWGTIHDGKNLYPGIREQLRHLKQLKKYVIFISNTPRPQEAIFSFLSSLGLTTQEYDALITSGDVFLKSVPQDPTLQEPFYFMGDPILHAPLLQRLHTPCQSIEEAAYILCSAVPPHHEFILKEALAHQKLLVCINPDPAVIENGHRLICPGSLAQTYEAQGGCVAYYGKPYPAIFEHVFHMFKNPSKEKVLMIGDGIYTDILGASRYGIDSLLVNTGLHYVTDLPNSNQDLDKPDQNLGIKPTYFIESLGQN